MPTPLMEDLQTRAGRRLFRGHAPGHKGKPLPYLPKNPAAIDLNGQGADCGLFSSAGALTAAETLMAEACGAPNCAFLTGGAHAGLLTALQLAAPRGGKVLVDRGCSLGVFHALALNDLHPTYLYTETLPDFGVTGGVNPAAVRMALELEPGIRAVVLTSPTRYGVISELAAIADICHERDAKLVVDESLGAHLPFLEDSAGCAAALGADFSVCSAADTLPVPGQTALLFWRDADSRRVRKILSIFAPETPSDILLAALDAMREYMQGEGRRQYARVAATVAQLRALADRCGFLALSPRENLRLDPLRLVVRTGSGRRDAERLESIHGIVCDFADSLSLSLLLTGMDTDNELRLLAEALTSLARVGGRGTLLAPPKTDSSRPEQVLSPRRVLNCAVEQVPLSRAVGRVSAQIISMSPPGIPMVMPGERIEAGHLENLQKRGYQLDGDVAVAVDV